MRPLLANRRSVMMGLAAVGFSIPILSAVTANWRWGIDYGASTEPETARHYGLLVLEPDHPRPLAPLRRASARLLGYMSLGEVERSRPFVSRLEAAGALRETNENWQDARLIDLRKDVWKSLILDELIPNILAKGFDGIFMDTLDNAEFMERSDPKGSAGMVAAAVELVAAIRSRFPAITIMMNRGYALLPTAAPQLNLLLGEAMASRWNFEKKTYEFTSQSDWQWQADRLRAAKDANPDLTLTTLDYWDQADQKTVASLYARERAAGFFPYVATLALDRLMPEPVA
jgi:uncharacterized protein (TIGR01370 family)